MLATNLINPNCMMFTKGDIFVGDINMPDSKLVTMSEAISRFVQNGSAVALGTAQETLIPFAAGHMSLFVKANATLL